MGSKKIFSPQIQLVAKASAQNYTCFILSQRRRIIKVSIKLLLMIKGAMIMEGKVLVLGVDGMDPRVTKLYMDQGLLPNIARFVQNGSARA